MTFSSKGKKPKNQIKLQMKNDRNEKMLLQHLGLPFFFHRVAPWFVEMITRENQQWAAADEINQQERETKKLSA